MKTAMQEMIDKLHARCDFCLEKELISEWGTLRMTIIEAQSFLEKEKEQIIDAMERTAMYVSAASLDKEIGKMTFEDLYNQTYKPETI